MKNIRTIIWDLDETLWFYLDNEPKVLCEKLNIDRLDSFEKEYYEMWGSLNTYFHNRIVTYDEMKQLIAQKIPTLKLYGISAEELLKAIREEKKNFIRLNKEAVEMMRYFARKGLTNISITDWFESDQWYALRSLNLHLYIDRVYGCDNDYLKCSSKKAEEISRKIIKNKPEEFLIIGDSLSSDVFLANQLGIKSIWYNRKGKFNQTENIPTMEVKSLLKLKEIL